MFFFNYRTIIEATMFNNQNYNNGENNEGVYTNDNRLKRVGLYISDTFDQSPSDTIDLTEDNYSSKENTQSHVIKKRIVPVRPYTNQKPTTVLSNGLNSIKIISSHEINQNLIQQNINVDGTHRSVFLMNDKMKMLARRKCVLQSEARAKIEKDEYHAVIVHEPEAKIPRPPNAFMIFANEWRKKVAHKYNNESNKDISVRLGHMWRSLDKSRKEEYFVMARKADAEHKMKYPDYVYNPKEARLRKALRDSWKDKGRRTPNGQFRSIVGKSPTNWSSCHISQDRTLLPMPSLSNMTFSMAADGYSMMETPAWSNSWYSYRHNPVPYIVPQFSEPYNCDSNDNYSDRMYHPQVNVQESGARASVIGPSPSPFADRNESVENDKGPLSQLQELTNVFSSTPACTRNADNEIKQEMPTTENDTSLTQVIPKAEVESTAFNNDSDSGYITDHPHPKETGGENDFNKNVSKTGVSDVLMTENNGETFMESFENNGQSNYINVDDVFLDCNFLSGEKNFGASSTLEVQAGDQGKNVLPGFQQAFGSTEIGRFSRNDFFTNPPPESTPDKYLDYRFQTDISTQPLVRTKRGKQPKQEPLDYSWNPIPNPSNFPTASIDVDFFSDLCDMEEELLDSHTMLSDPILINSVEPKRNRKSNRKVRTEKVDPKKPNQNAIHSGGFFKGEELLDVLATVGNDIDDFNMDELLKEEPDKFNINRNKE